MADSSLLDTYCGTQSLDEFHPGTRELIKKLTSVRREAFNIPALTFSVDSVKRERTFTRAAHAGDNGEGVARDCDIDISQVMLMSAGYYYFLVCHGVSLLFNNECL
jgi:hypothetical protein